jgi:hypothetical protein
VNSLVNAAKRAARSRTFLAWDLERVRATERLDRRGLAARFGIDDEALARLELCRSPRRDDAFRRDITTTAEYAGVDAFALAVTVRLADAMATFRTAPAAVPEALLAAARDAAGEPSLANDLPPTGTLYQPTWLQRALEMFWDGDRVDDYPRSLDLEAILRLPLAIVDLKGLSTTGIATWLDAHETDVRLTASPRPLRAALIAYGGAGVIFIDADLEDGERRVGLAHEIGHFLNDYLVPRHEIERSAPSLVDVVDGLRAPTREDKITALLARVPLGTHTHLLGRTVRGEYGSVETERSEERATRVAWELIAPQEAVLKSVPDPSNVFAVVQVLRDRFGFPLEAARAYADYLSEAGGGDGDFDRRFRFDT